MSGYQRHDFNYASISQSLAEDLRDVDATLYPRDSIRRDAFGIFAEPYPLGSATAALSPVSQSLYGSLVGFKAGDVITNVLAFASTVGTVSAAYGAVYGLDGTKLAASADFHASWAAGLNVMPMGTPYTVPKDEALYLCFDLTWSVQPKLPGGLAFTAPKIGSGPVDWVADASQATPPSSATFTANGLGKFWLAAS